MNNNAKVLGEKIERAIDAEIARHLGQVSNAILRASIEDILRDSACEKILTALSSVPPKTIDVATAVRQSMDELAQQMKGVKGSLKSRFSSAGSTNDNGGKNDSGAKSSSRYTPPSRSYGGKDGGHGGK